MDHTFSSKSRILGLFELDENGKVIFASLEVPNGKISGATVAKGADFFAEVSRFANAPELQRRFEMFREMQRQAQSFDFTCDYDDGPAEVKVIMARLDKNCGPPSFLVHVRLADSSPLNLAAAS
jgi:hypothetical protein